ncbi:hypothetical protein BD626DRAFT_574673 [Schizophyllum amplum]|uniref:Uncharacterized protein n=1 Tax=Schizophyllum amplum TaxID=97359 RepID=A0A550BSJ2_9AGAR|nr:hypothetical protein BD626DRAFT_577381 [Auriculariopsis ampla]TRM56042.1 hypothetical protein BD626DRAFT_576208 [Auriculariopsis ampla]TRM57361.1 hypothetical protein BD626DRAFT_574673 [Auriculariopsis ampla]
MCRTCISNTCPVYELLKKVIMLGMTYDELLRACEEEEERWKRASARIVMLNKTRTRWGDIYTDMFENSDDTEERVEDAMRAEGVYVDSEEDEIEGETTGIDRDQNRWAEDECIDP